jgi:ribonucleoside-diphosphate reductase alpha chain
MLEKYSHTLKDGTKETWENIAYRVTKHVMKAVDITMRDNLAKEIFEAIKDRKFLPGGRYLYATGRPYHNCQNCLLLKAEDSREGWADLLHKVTMGLMTGSGLGVDYSDIRAEGKIVRKIGGVAAGPIPLMEIVNECARSSKRGGSGRGALWAGLNWQHSDIHKFITAKNWSDEIKMLKAKNFNFPAQLDATNISVLLDDEFFEAYHDDKHILHSSAQNVYWTTVKQMLKTAEPGFSVNTGKNKKETLRNACCELVSEDDSDICNIGSINMARVTSHQEMTRLVEIATAFLLAGTVYSDVPYPKVDQVRTKNRRLGLGLMGLHEWLLLNGKSYGPDKDLEEYLKIYAESGKYAKQYAKKWDLTVPVKTKAIAPTGSLSIIAETTSGVEPIFCIAYKRRYLKHTTWHYQYVVDPTAKRLIEEKGVKPEAIEDAYILAEDVERRVAFQAWVQQYVDHGISSTINLPRYGSSLNNDGTVRAFGNMLIKFLPSLRGITCYPEGSREGQPLTPVSYKTATSHIGEVFIEQADVCSISGKSACGS